MNYGVYSQGDILVNEDSKPLTNFSVRTLEKFYAAEDEEGIEMMQLTVRCLGTDYQINLNLSSPSLLGQIQQAIPTCKVLAPKMRPHIEAYILEMQPTASEDADARPLYFCRNGFHKLKCGVNVFVAGDEVLGLPEGRKWAISPEVARAHLAWDETITEIQAVQELWTVLNRNREILLPIWAFTLVSSMRSVLLRLNITTFPACAVTGRQGAGKTTTCQRFALLYDDTHQTGRRWGEIDAGSSESAMRDIISECCDQVVLVDDVAKSISPSQVRRRKGLLANALRFACNDTSLSKKEPSGQVRTIYCTAGLLYTGELSLDNPSDIGRVIPVQIDEQMQGGSPKDRVLAATAFRYFIQWFLPKMESSVASLEKDLDAVDGDNQRIHKNRTLILWALQQFFCYAEELGAALEKKTEKMMRHTVEICDDITRTQIEQIQQMERPDCLSWYILDGINRNLLKYVKRSDLDNEKELPKFYCVYLKKNDSVAITMQVLFQYFEKHTSLHLSSPAEMGKRLKNEGVIHPGQEGKSAKKKINRDRYMEMRRADLLEACRRMAKT